MSRIKIFKSFEEQDQYQVEKMRTATPTERFRKLFYMQKLSSLFHPTKNQERKIVIHHGYPSS